ncbi:hypothetical protein D9756_008467 [Leucocoprinus leucothites]|uniref:Proteasome beta subunit C-terminal domain-containing protein n=1 Tax=Leucocoprinus leucothites TaxID=201217 RepID=A0A8H5D082_9AGAR|nr:hypothetical protein D9756_008467 [Leucoagaricus leucothites]
MAQPSVYRSPGFDFSNQIRNNFLSEKGLPLPNATSTGTTIVGCLFKDGIVLGADTRATEGTAADTEFTTALISSNMELHTLSSGRKPRVVTAMTMLKQMLFRYQGHIGAALVLGGVDATGPQLFTIHPHGSTDKLPYVTMGSGSLAAMAVFESGWRANMERQDALDLVFNAISAGIFNDLGSGSNVDACIITADNTEMLRNINLQVDRSNVRPPKEREYKFRRGTTAWTKEDVRKLIVEEDITTLSSTTGAGDEMDTS